MDPATLALAQAGIGAFGSAMGAPKMSSSGPIYTNPVGMFDHSAWTVATGKGQASATVAQPAAASLLGYIPWIIGGFVAVMALKAWRK